MSAAEILEELPLLTTHDRAQIGAEIARLDEMDWQDADDLTQDEKKMIVARLREADEHPERLIPWNEAKTRLQSAVSK